MERARLEPVIDLLILKSAYVWMSMPGPDCVIYGGKQKHGSFTSCNAMQRLGNDSCHHAPLW